MKRIIALLLALVMVFALVACGDKQAEQPKESETPAVSNDPAPSESTPAEPAPSESAPVEELNNEMVDYYMQKANEVKVTDTHVIFTDDGSGQELTVEKNPKNVAVLYGSLAALWYEAGGTAPLVIGGKSAVELYTEQIGRDITKDEGVKVVATSSSGTKWDIEAILAEKPDLIITSVGMKGYSTISGPAAAVGVPTIGINYDGVQDYLKWFKVFCNLSGHPELWEEVAEKTAKGIIDVVSKVPENVDAPEVAVLVINSDKLKAYTFDSQPGAMLKELGGVNVFDRNNEGASSTIDISLEDLYAQDPDIIFLAWYNEPGMMYNQLMEMVEGNPVWDALRANKEGKFFLLDKNLFHNKANRLYDQSYKTLAQYLYPDVEF